MQEVDLVLKRRSKWEDRALFPILTLLSNEVLRIQVRERYSTFRQRYPLDPLNKVGFVEAGIYAPPPRLLTTTDRTPVQYAGTVCSV